MKTHKFISSTFLIGLLIVFALPLEAFTQRMKVSHKKYHQPQKRTTYTKKNNRYSNSSHKIQYSGRKYGHSVTHMHRDAVVVKYGHSKYHYYKGHFYKPHHNRYVIVRPAVGFRINFLPLGFRTVYIDHRPYYYHHGVFYRKVYMDEYEVIRPPLDAIIEYLPEGAQLNYIDGREYYAFDGVYYKPIILDGYIMYKVAGYY